MIIKRRFLLVAKLSITILVLIGVLYVTPQVFSKYESISTTVVDTEIAFYVINASYYSQSMHLTDVRPRANPYVYTFTVSNFNGNNRLDVDLTYDLSIITTTNLPIDYELYVNEADYTNPGAENIITSDTIVTDEDGTFFRTMTTATRLFGFTSDQTNTYTLVIYYPTTNISYQYQDVMENIDIIIDSRQTMS